jgi:hypothetical protein
MHDTTKRSRFSPGKLVLSIAALYPTVGAFAMDWNETHIHNPDWPPHAKFHNAQTMSTAAQCTVLSLWQLWRPGAETRSRLHWTLLFNALFVATQAPAILFPGTDWADPGQPHQPFTKAGIPVNQLTIEGSILTPLLLAGYLLENRRLRALGCG